ncbi:hypothetical protein WN944_025598 [Citrus x changshan-huyou]|uniref:Uncharacterized protein n=2 Tax=Citrus TaxID=2706 RepID=A0ACB8I7X5_CITSI|nr:hypothetical protein KPL71_027571 [Citrus sinensis]
MSFFTLLCIFLLILSINLHASSATTENNSVLSFGAKGNGVTDSTQAFPKHGLQLVPPQNQPQYMYQEEDYSVLGQSDNWLSFEGVSSVSIIGGALDAKGSSLWACKGAGSNCPNGATGLHNYL